jgi:hypothetical protein
MLYCFVYVRVCVYVRVLLCVSVRVSVCMRARQIAIQPSIF